MITRNSQRFLCIAVGVMHLACCSTASATLLFNQVSTATDTAYDSFISATDLINVGQPTLVGSPTSTNPTIVPYTIPGLHDGSAAVSANWAYWGTSPSTVTFTLNTTLNPLGYDITSIQAILGYLSQREVYASHTYSIYYRLVDDLPMTYTLLTTTNYTPFGPGGGAGSSMVTITDSSGLLLSGVAELQIIAPLITPANETAVYRELDVFGAPTPGPVPEPSTFAMLGLAVVGLTLSSRARRRVPLALPVLLWSAG